MRDNLGRINTWLDSVWKSDTIADAVAKNPGCKVSNYNELVEKIAKIAFYNPHLNLFFRGQIEDHGFEKNNDDPAKNQPSNLYPPAYRVSEVGRPAGSKELIEAILPEVQKELISELKKEFSHRSKIIRGLERYPEATWAILQHYGFPTPLLDVTKSIQVAASFATRKMANNHFSGDSSESGFVYVLGLPEPHGFISYYAHDCLVLARLLSLCPPEAKRPHFQQGFLVGTYPHGPIKKMNYKYRDFRLRLVAKFKLEPPSSFWNNSSFNPYGPEELYPDDDSLKQVVDIIKDNYLSDFRQKYNT